jgi:hypothetical protein
MMSNLLEQRVQVLEARVSLLENQLRSYVQSSAADADGNEQADRVRLGHIVQILRRLGGTATLDQVASQNKSITKSGTRAQLVRLCEIDAVRQPRRGHYSLVER